jgi:large repetitive protein
MKSGIVTASTRLLRALKRSSRVGTLLVAAIGLAIFSVATAIPALAGNGGSGVQLFNETFSNNTVPTSEVVLPDLPTGLPQSGNNEACLTAAGTPSGPSAVTQCSGASDSPGFLRFTQAGGTEEGGVFSATSVPATQGLDVTFNSYQWGGNGADGIAFALAIANPSDPQPPAQIGYSGGSLGYAPYQATSGLTYGYLGVGLDAYGNFSTSGVDGSGCSTPGGTSRAPEAVSIRGPGNGVAGYCMLGGPWTDGGANLRSASSTAVPVEVAINPTGTSFTTASLMVVPALSYAVQWTPVGGAEVYETGTLPDLNDPQYSGLDIPSSYYNSAGIPYQLTFGWVASTGSHTDNHEIDNVVVDSGTSNVSPALALTATDSDSGQYGQGTSADYQFTPSLSGANENGTITFSDPFPAGLTPEDTLGTDPSWTCGIADSTVTCTHAGTTSPSTMGDIDIAASVAPNASTDTDALDDRGYISADDASDADALAPGTAYGPATVTSLSPNTGTMVANTQVAVTGTNFNNVSSVNVGSATVTAQCSINGPTSDCYTVNSPTSITVQMPTGVSAGGAGAQQVTVTNDVGAGSGSTYTYTGTVTTTTVSSSVNPSVSGQAASFTATVTPAVAGTVTFAVTPSQGSAVACTGGDTVTLSSSAATCSLPVGTLLASGSTYTVTANYNGNGNFLTSTGTLNPAQTVNLGPTTTATPTSTVNPSVFGESVTYATTVASVAPGAGVPTGVVQFEETVGGVTTTMCAGSLNGSGATSCTSSALPPAGTASVQATYLGDTNYSTSTSSGLVQFVDQAATSTLLSSNLNPSGFGKPVTFTATVSPTAPGGGTPTGQVSFSSDGTPITGCSNIALNGSAQAICTTSSLSVTGHTVVAAYAGNVDYVASSGSLTQTVGEQATTTSEMLAPNPSVTGQVVNVTANVSYTGSGTPTGTVAFTITPTSSGLAPQCAGGNNVALNGAGSAVCTLNLSALGAPYGIQAEYNGDGNFDASGSSVLTQNVNADPTTTSVSTSNPSAVTDQSVTFTATVSGVAPGSGAPSDGTVAFDVGGAPVAACASQVVTNGTATCTVSDLDVAGSPYSVTAFYGGATDYASSNNSGSPLTQAIGADATATSVTSNTNPSTFGQSVTFTATVTASAPGSGVPAGSATISADGLLLCGGALTAGQFTCPVSTLTAGTHQITASYSASTDYNSSTSPTITQGVNQSSTTTTVTSSDNPSSFGESVTVRATVAPVGPGQGTPTGLEDFSNGIVPICVNVPLSDGVATCTFNYALGSYTIVAAYRGSAGFIQSSGQMTQTVQQAATTSTVVSAPDAVTGQTSSYEASVGVNAPGTTQLANLTGTVSIYAQDVQTDPQVLLCTTNVGLSGSTVSCSSSAAVASGAPWSVTAVYSGDSNFTTSTSSAVTQTVGLAATATDVSAVVNPAAVTGQNVTATAGFSVTPPGTPNPVTPTGQVEFEISLDGGTTYNAISGCLAQSTSWNTEEQAGSAACTFPSPPATSSVKVEAIYSGDTNFATSTSTPVTVAVNLASTSTSLGVDTNPSVSGQTVNYTATVAVTPPGSDSTPPTGTLEFEYSTTGGITWDIIPGCATKNLVWDTGNHTGSAPCSTSFNVNAQGTQVQVVYSGDSNFDGSTSSPMTQVVNAAQTTTSVLLDPQNTVSGQAIAATATVSITPQGSDSAGMPTGPVDFQYSSDGGVDWNAIPSCATEPLTWNSDPDTGTASCSASFDAGSSPVEVEAIYTGDLSFSLSTSPSATETVTPAATTTSVIATPGHTVTGQTIGLSATVSVTAPGTDSPSGPSGAVDFQSSANGTTWNDISNCTDQLLTWNSDLDTGTASCSTALAAVSTGDQIQAVYSGDSNFTTSTSSAVTQTVGLAATSIGVTSSANPSVNGQTITIGANVSVASPGGDVPVGPTGTVVFESSTNGGVNWTPVAACTSEVLAWSSSVQQGTAGCSETFVLSQSGIKFEALYSGDGNFRPSASGPVTQTVNQARTSTVVTSAPNSSGPLQPVTFMANVSVVAPGSGVLSGTVTFTDGGSTLCGAVALNASASASCTTHLSITATQSVSATYSGNTVLAGSSGSIVQSVRHGYWLLGADGGVFSYGDAQFYGSLPQIGYTPAGSGGPHELNAPLVGIQSTLSGNGYWLVASDGGIFSFGDAVFHGSTGHMRLAAPIVAMAVTPDGNGYWLVGSDGGVFAYGDARFYGSTGAMHLNKPIVAMAVTPDGKGYWLVASDGGVFAFGDAHYEGSPSTGPIPTPVVGMARTSNGQGYWLASAGGHVYSYGGATAVPDATAPPSPVVGMAGTADAGGYWMATSSGGLYTFGDAMYDGSASDLSLQRPIVGLSGI